MPVSRALLLCQKRVSSSFLLTGFQFLSLCFKLFNALVSEALLPVFEHAWYLSVWSPGYSLVVRMVLEYSVICFVVPRSSEMVRLLLRQ